MAQLFPKWTNRIPLFAAGAGIGGMVAVVLFFWYFGSPWYTDVGYRPTQPVAYSHKLHAGDLGLDCRYCHTNVEISPYAGVPPTKTCMNCHEIIGTDNTKLLPVRESWATGKPIEWIRIHHLPDYAYFDHSVHIRAGVGCESCHGNVRQMEKVMMEKPLSMGWCLDCHRDPDSQLRPSKDITVMNWTPDDDHEQFVQRLKAEKHIKPPEDCAACHR